MSDKCPFCGAGEKVLSIWNEKYACGTFKNHQSEHCKLIVRHRKLVEAAKNLLDNPYPHDLFAIRRKVVQKYDGDEEWAKKSMSAWCSEDYCCEQFEKHEKAKKELREAIENIRKDGVECGNASADHTTPTAYSVAGAGKADR